ncbi:MAG: hypothetical protein KDK36_20260, partial [Leptospiraceae bacterium]|nr:hypothetical protein [Leptospiraceae bacterium]
MIFGYLYWKIPDESPWSTNFFYGFENQFRRLSKKFKENKTKKILLLGSSVAAYSLHPEFIQKTLLENYNLNSDVEILSFAGMTPLDVYMMRNKINLLNEDVIVYPINFIDYRIHRNYQIHPGEKSFITTDEEFLLNDALDYGNAPQARIFYPLEIVLEFWNVLPLEKLADYLSSFIIKTNRYRDIVWDNIKLFYNHRYGRNTSYHGYMGTNIPETVDSLGWTTKRFSFYPKKYMKSEGFYIQVVPEILKDGKLEISILNKNSDVIQKEIYTTPGWKKIILNENASEKDLITIELSNSWKANEAIGDRFDFHRDEMGVRLQQNFGERIPNRIYHIYREERKEDRRYLNMSEDEYKEYFYYRLLDNFDKRPGLTYFHSIYEAKKKISEEKFTIHTQLKYLKKAIEYFEKQKVKVILINNPENPITLGLYKDSRWYKGKLEFLKNLEGNFVKVFDWKEKLNPQDFSD